MNFNNYIKKPKLYDRVILKDYNIEGKIDTILNNRYRVITKDGYYWVNRWDFILNLDFKMIDKEKSESNIKQMLKGDIY